MDLMLLVAPDDIIHEKLIFNPNIRLYHIKIFHMISSLQIWYAGVQNI